MSSYPNALPHWNDPVHGSLQSHKKPAGSSTASASTSSRVRHPGLASAAPNVIPMSPQAFDNNAKLFPVFEAHLSDAKYGGNYQPSAEKFAGWLSRDKAYYTTARPWIVKLLERAQATIREVGGHRLPHDRPFHISQCPPELDYWVAPYVRLIHTVRPFDHLFIEPDLRARLEALLRTIEQPRTPTPVHHPPHFVTQQPFGGAAAPRFVPQESRPASTSSMHSIAQSATPPAAVLPSAAPPPPMAPYFPSSSHPRAALPPILTRSIVITDTPQVASPVAMSPFYSAHPTPISRPGSTHSIHAAPARVSSAASASYPQSRVGSISHPRVQSPLTPSAVHTPVRSPDLGQIVSDFAKKDLEWAARHPRPQGQPTIQSRADSASAPVPPQAGPLSSTPSTAGESVSAPVKKKSKSKSSSLLSKGFLDADVEWFQQQQKPKQPEARALDPMPVEKQAEPEASHISVAKDSGPVVLEVKSGEPHFQKEDPAPSVPSSSAVNQRKERADGAKDIEMADATTMPVGEQRVQQQQPEAGAPDPVPVEKQVEPGIPHSSTARAPGPAVVEGEKSEEAAIREDGPAPAMPSSDTVDQHEETAGSAKDVEMVNATSISGADEQSPGQGMENKTTEEQGQSDASSSSVPSAFVEAPPQTGPDDNDDTKASTAPADDTGVQSATAIEVPPLSRSPSPSPGPVAVPSPRQSPIIMGATVAHSKSPSETREVDLSKFRTPKPKSKRPSGTDFAFTRVAHTPENNAAANATSPSALSVSAPPPTEPPTDKADIPSPVAHQVTTPSHKVKSKKKGPPGIRATEFSPPRSAESSLSSAPPPESPRLTIKVKSRKGPPGVKVLPIQESVSDTSTESNRPSGFQVPEGQPPPELVQPIAGGATDFARTLPVTTDTPVRELPSAHDAQVPETSPTAQPVQPIIDAPPEPVSTSPVLAVTPVTEPSGAHAIEVSEVQPTAQTIQSVDDAPPEPVSTSTATATPVAEPPSAPPTSAPMSVVPRRAIHAETPEPGEITEYEAPGVQIVHSSSGAATASTAMDVDGPSPSAAVTRTTQGVPPRSEGAAPPEAPTMDVDRESETDEPLSARHKRVSFQATLPESLKRIRSRSPSIPLSNQRRRVTPKSLPGASSSSAVPSENAPQAVRATPREYSAAAFDSGNYVYSPVVANFEPPAVSHPHVAKAGNARDRRKGPSKGASRSKAAHTKISWQAVGVVVPTDAELARMPLFAEDSVVLGLARGQPSGVWKPTSFEFDLDEDMVKALKLWGTRNDHKEDLASARCLSLACYKFSDCIAALDKSDMLPDNKDPFTGRPASWPPYAPSVVINEGQTCERRFAIRSGWTTDADHIVDISKRVQPGRNTVDLHRDAYTSPLDDYVFVLRLHPPTPRQNAEISKLRGNSLAWTQFLAECSIVNIPEFDADLFNS